MPATLGSADRRAFTWHPPNTMTPPLHLLPHFYASTFSFSGRRMDARVLPTVLHTARFTAIVGGGSGIVRSRNAGGQRAHLLRGINGSRHKSVA